MRFQTLRTLLLTAAMALPAAAQSNHFISSSGDVVLSATAYAMTLQQPALTGATGAKDVVLESATVYCSVAATVSHIVSAAAATATAGTIVAKPGNTSTVATAKIFTNSNASGGTTLRVDHVPAGSTFTYNFEPEFRLSRSGTGSNYTISIASLSGTCNITISHGEPRQ